MRNISNYLKVLLLAVAFCVAGCAPRNTNPPTPEDIERWVGIGSVAAMIGCEEVSDALKAEEREALTLSLAVVLSAKDGDIKTLTEALAAIEQLKPSHRLLIGLAMREAWLLIPEGYRESDGAAVTATLISACMTGVEAGTP